MEMMDVQAAIRLLDQSSVSLEDARKELKPLKELTTGLKKFDDLQESHAGTTRKYLKKRIDAINRGLVEITELMKVDAGRLEAQPENFAALRAAVFRCTTEMHIARKRLGAIEEVDEEAKHPTMTFRVTSGLPALLKQMDLEEQNRKIKRDSTCS